MIQVLFLSALSPFCTAAQDPAASDVARLVPADAFLTVRVESAERLHGLAVRLASLGDQVLPADAVALLSEMDVPGDVAQIDLARPAFVALSLGGGSVVPTFVVPARDAQAYASSLAAEATFASAVQGAYVGVSLRPGYAAAGAANPMVAALRPGLVSARVDLSTLIRTFRPMIEMGLGQVEMMMDQMPMDQAAGMDMGAMLEVYVDGLWAFVDSADQLDLVLDFDGKLLQQRSWLSTLPESPMAELGGSESYDLRPAAGWFDPAAGFSMLMACDMAKLLERFGPTLDMLVDAYPAELSGVLKRYMEAYRPVLPLMGPVVAASGDFGAGGMRIAYGLFSPEPAKLSEEMRVQLAAMASSATAEAFSIGAPEEIEIAGGRALRTRVSFDIASLSAGLAPGGEADPEGLGQFQAMMQAFYGAGGLQMVWRPLSDRLVMALGGDDAFAAATLVAKPRAFASLPPELRAAVESASGGSLALVYRIDYARILSGMAPMFAGMGMDELDVLSGTDLRLPVTVWMSVAGPTWSAGAGVDIDQLTALVTTLKSAVQAESAGGDEEDR